MTARHCNIGGRLADDRGTTAVEFAIIAPVVIMLLVGITSLSLMLFALGSMHFAVEDAARCASARPTQCSSPSAIIAYAQSRYAGALAPPVFTHTAAACGNKVNATVTFTFDAGMYRQSVPLAATACFPS
jgi:Flp pilus assembly protein TadG